MESQLLRDLRSRRPQIRARWEMLLRTEETLTPLAHPDTLVHMLDWTMNQVFSGLEAPGLSPLASPESFDSIRALCPCGRNPYLNLFLAGEQALLEGLILCQAGRSVLEPEDRDREVSELYGAIRSVAAREVASFCSVCQYRETTKPSAASSSAMT